MNVDLNHPVPEYDMGPNYDSEDYDEEEEDDVVIINRVSPIAEPLSSSHNESDLSEHHHHSGVRDPDNGHQTENNPIVPDPTDNLFVECSTCHGHVEIVTWGAGEHQHPICQCCESHILLPRVNAHTVPDCGHVVHGSCFVNGILRMFQSGMISDGNFPYCCPVSSCEVIFNVNEVGISRGLAYNSRTSVNITLESANGTMSKISYATNALNAAVPVPGPEPEHAQLDMINTFYPKPDTANTVILSEADAIERFEKRVANNNQQTPPRTCPIM
jgi:hypothetical protein